MAEVRSFCVGYCAHPACMALKGAGVASRKFPARAYLLESRGELFLWDTGYAPAFRKETKGLYALYRWVTPVHYDHEQEHLAHQLRHQGIRSQDICAVVVSHFHADHIAGLSDYPNVPVFASQAGLTSIRGLTGWRALQKAFVPGLLPADFGTRVRPIESLPYKTLPPELHPFSHGSQLDSAGDIWIVSLPGHAEGHVGAFVRTTTGWVLLASDAAWAPEAYQAQRGPSELSFLIQHSRPAYYATLAALHAVHQRGVKILLTHEAS